MSTAKIMIRVSDADFAIDDFLELHPEFAPTNLWRLGERRRTGQALSTSGFSLVGGDAAAFPSSAEDVIGKVRAVRQALDDAGMSRVALTVDFPMFIRQGKVTRFEKFSVEFLRDLADARTELEVSGYATEP